MTIIDADIMPDEDEPHALARTQRDAAAVSANRPELVVEAAGSIARARLDADAYGALMRGQLFVGLYNLTGQRPNVDDFAPAANWSDDDRAGLGLPRRSRLLLPANALARPMRIESRVGLAPLHEGRGGPGHYLAKIMIRADLKTTYVSHFTVGRRGSGILTAGQFDVPLKMLGGHHLQLGLVLSQPALDAAPTRKALTDGE